MYKLIIKTNIDGKEDIMLLRNEFCKMNVGDGVKILRNPKKDNEAVLIDTQNKLIMPLIMSYTLLGVIVFHWLKTS